MEDPNDRQFYRLLPRDMWLAVLGCLDVMDLFRTSTVCSGWNVLILSSVQRIDKISPTVKRLILSDGWVRRFMNIVSLDLTTNENVTNSGIGGLIHLTELNLTLNKLITMDGLNNLTKLTNLQLNHNKIITNECLNRMTQLRFLDLTSNYLISDGGLKSLNQLSSLDLSAQDNKNIFKNQKTRISGSTSPLTPKPTPTRSHLGMQPRFPTPTPTPTPIISSPMVNPYKPIMPPFTKNTNKFSANNNNNNLKTDAAYNSYVSMHQSINDKFNIPINDSEASKLLNTSPSSMSNVKEEKEDYNYPSANSNYLFIKGISDEGLKYVSRLQHLSLNRNNTISNFGLSYLPFLTSLDLAYNEVITDAAVIKLVYLRKLSLVGNSLITNDSVMGLFSLTYLNLANNKLIGDKSVENLCELRTLIISGVRVSDLTNASVKKLKNLTHLDLTYNWKISDDGISNLIELRTLALNHNEMITVNAISKLTNLTRLELSSHKTIKSNHSILSTIRKRNSALGLTSTIVS
jgi:Leucine-rich repeat (LRR) protein